MRKDRMELNKASMDASCAYAKDMQPENETSVGPQDARDVRQFVINKDHRHTGNGVQNKSLRDRKSEESKQSTESSGFLREEKKDKSNASQSSNYSSKDQAFAEALSGLKLEFASLGSSMTTLSATDIQWVENVISQTVDSMIIGGSDEAQFCEIVLAQDGTVPMAFEGANMTIAREGFDIKVNIGNFGSTEDLNQAVMLVESGKGNLAELVKSLQLRQINLSEFKVGNHIVQLPSLMEEKQTPIHMIAAAFKHHEEEKKDDQRQGGKDHRDPEKDRFLSGIEEV